MPFLVTAIIKPLQARRGEGGVTPGGGAGPTVSEVQGMLAARVARPRPSAAPSIRSSSSRRSKIEALGRLEPGRQRSSTRSPRLRARARSATGRCGPWTSDRLMRGPHGRVRGRRRLTDPRCARSARRMRSARYLDERARRPRSCRRDRARRTRRARARRASGPWRSGCRGPARRAPALIRQQDADAVRRLDRRSPSRRPPTPDRRIPTVGAGPTIAGRRRAYVRTRSLRRAGSASRPSSASSRSAVTPRPRRLVPERIGDAELGERTPLRGVRRGRQHVETRAAPGRRPRG